MRTALSCARLHLGNRFWMLVCGCHLLLILSEGTASAQQPTPRCLAFSPDGKLLAIGYGLREKGKVILCNVADGRAVKEIGTSFEV